MGSTVPIMQDLTIETYLYVLDCCSCGTTFAMGKNLKRQRVDDHQNFYCPNGHSQHFTGETEAQKYKRFYEYSQQREQATADQLEASERSRRAIKGQNTKLKRRIAAGVCPCCHRSFKDLARHMEGQHPDFAKETDE